MDGDGLYFSALLNGGRPADLALIQREHLAKPWQRIYDFVLEFMREQRQLPQATTVERQFQLGLPLAVEPAAYYAKAIRDNAMRAVMERGFEERVVGPLGEHKPEAALAGAAEVVGDIRREFRPVSDHLVLDLAENVEERWAAYDLRRRSLNQSGIPYAWPTMTAATGGKRCGEGIVIAARPSCGKAQPLDAKVLTPSGWRLMGDISVGDAVVSVDELSSIVVGVYPQGVKQVYRVTLSDGRSTEACAEHLWRVNFHCWDSPRVVTTAKLSEMLSRKRYRRRLWVDLFAGNYGVDESVLLDPWLMGALLGNGCFRSSPPSFTSADAHVVERLMQALPAGVIARQRPNRSNEYDLVAQPKGAQNVITAMLDDLGLKGLLSIEKFVPDDYLRGSYKTRAELLCGLLDTDGESTINGSVVFSTSSLKLAKDVQYLIRSLGGIARLGKPKNPKYVYRGETRVGQPAYRITVSHPNAASFMSLPRKKERIRRFGPRTIRLTVESVEASRVVPAQCIAVSHSRSLYITDDFVVTHNTWAAVVDAQFCREQGYNVLFASGETPPHTGRPKRTGHRVLQGRCVRCYVAGVAESDECPAAGVRQQRLSQRFDAVGGRVSAYRLMQGALLPNEVAQLRRYYDICRDPGGAGYSWGRLKIVSVPAITSVVDLEMAADEFVPDIIYFDSVYVLATRYKKRQNEAAGQLVMDLKQAAERMGVPLVVTWHFNRDVREEDTSASQNSLALTDEISRIFDCIIGLFRPNDVADAGEASWQSLKVRDGIRMPELRTHFKLRNEVRFDEIAAETPQ